MTTSICHYCKQVGPWQATTLVRTIFGTTKEVPICSDALCRKTAEAHGLVIPKKAPPHPTVATTPGKAKVITAPKPQPAPQPTPSTAPQSAVASAPAAPPPIPIKCSQCDLVGDWPVLMSPKPVPGEGRHEVVFACPEHADALLQHDYLITPQFFPYQPRVPHLARNGKPIYTWWDQLPPWLQTQTQLTKAKLQTPAAPAAYIHYGKGSHERIYDLYDARQATPKPEVSPARKAGIEAAQLKRRTCSDCGKVVEKPKYLTNHRCYDCQVVHHKEARREELGKIRAWAKRMLADQRACILDVETTGLDGEIVEIAIIDLAGEVLFHSLIRPMGSMGATEIHGITEATVSDAPRFAEVAKVLWYILQGRRCLGYNIDFDTGRIEMELRAMAQRKHGPKPSRDNQDAYAAWIAAERATDGEIQTWMKRVKWTDVMERYSAWCGDWHEYYQNYRWQPAPYSAHRATEDCLGTLRLLKELATATKEEIAANAERTWEAGVA